MGKENVMKGKSRIYQRQFVLLSIILCILGSSIVAALALEGPVEGVTGKTGATDGSIFKTEKALAMEAFGQMPLYFIENQGQKDDRVRYYTKGRHHTIWLTRTGVYFTFRDSRGTESLAENRMEETRKEKILSQRPVQKVKTVIVQLVPLGMRKGAQIKGVDQQRGKVNYFVGNDPKKWHGDIPTYKAVVYQEAYDGIDLRFFGKGQYLEYDVIVQPGADPGQVMFQYGRVKTLELTPDGHMAVKLPDGAELRQKKPTVYQDIDGKRFAREGRFRIAKVDGAWQYGFELGPYDSRHPLVIDPVTLGFSTYLGGTGSDEITDIAIDNLVHVTGWTDSIGFPVNDTAFQTETNGQTDAFVTQFFWNGSLAYSTYLGGSGFDKGLGIAVSQTGRAFVTGLTQSDDFPTKDAVQAEYGGSGDAFVVELDGSSLKYSTYLGGTSADEGRGIAFDHNWGDTYVTGRTYSTDFPTKNPYQSEKKGNRDAFVTKLDLGGQPLIYSTYLGGSDDDEANDIAIAGVGEAYVTGYTTSTDFPTKADTQGVFQSELAGGRDAFVTKFEEEGSALKYSTYLGGSDSDTGNSIAVRSLEIGGDCAYVTGVTHSADFPTQNPYQAQRNGYQDAFVSKFNYYGSELVYSTYLGGGNMDEGAAIDVDQDGHSFVTGWTGSTDFPSKDPYQGYGGFEDAFVTKFDTDGATLVDSTYLGGISRDGAYGIAAALGGEDAFVAGYTYSTNFPTHNAYQPDLHGEGTKDGFVARLNHKLTSLPNLTYWKASQNSSFSITPVNDVNWGDEVTVNLAYQNNGDADIPAGTRIRYRLYLSPDSTITTNDYYWKGYYTENGLKAGYGSYKSPNINLPASPPSGLPASGKIYIGMILDPLGEIDESNENDNSNQGLGRDYASLSLGDIPATIIIANMTFKSGQTYEYVATQSITIGVGVTVENGATVTFIAPIVKIQSGFDAKKGSTVKILQQAATSDALTAPQEERIHEENGTIVKIK